MYRARTPDGDPWHYILRMIKVFAVSQELLDFLISQILYEQPYSPNYHKKQKKWKQTLIFEDVNNYNLSLSTGKSSIL